jgi:hypothetical protein
MQVCRTLREKENLMFRRARIIGALAVGVVALQAGDAKAHYYTYVNGYLTHLFSFGCNALLKSVPNPETNPALFRCTATVKEVQVLCVNPAGNEVFSPGQAGLQVVLVGETEIQPGDWDKKKGKASVQAHISEDALVQDEYCVNPNWHAIDAISLAIDANLEVFECTGDKSDPCATTAPNAHASQFLECTLPPGFDVTNTPPNTNYDCIASPAVHNQ